MVRFGCVGSVSGAVIWLLVGRPPMVLGGTCPIEHLIVSGDGATDDYFARAVDLYGDTAVIGADSDDDNGNLAGSAYVFRYDGSGWVEEQKLLASDGSANDYFGYSVAVEEDVLMVGSYQGGPASSGSAHVFRFDGIAWVLETELTPDPGAGLDAFGYSVGLSGNVAVVGAPFDDDFEFDGGAAYFFRFDGADWTQEAQFFPHPGEDLAVFGIAVAVSGDVAIIGALNSDINAGNDGSVHVFRYDGATWHRTAELKPDDGAKDDRFGQSVAIDGATALIGAYWDDVNGADSGSAYVFGYNGNTWVQEQKLFAADGANSDNFGYAVSVFGDSVAVGARFDSDNGLLAGSAYVFTYDGSVWIQEHKLLATEAGDQAYFGAAVAGWSDRVLIGAYEDDHNGPDFGAAYVFDGVSGADCNGNGIPDACDISDGTSSDDDGNGVPDECEQVRCPGDANGDGTVDQMDSGYVLSRFGCPVGSGDPDCDAADQNGDGIVDPLDVGYVLSRFGECE